MKLLTELYDYQKPVVEKGLRKKALLNTLKTGQGKTVVELAIASNLYNRGLIDLVVVLTPKNAYTKQVWAKHIKTHTDVESQDFEVYVKRKKLLAPIVYGKHTHCKSYTRELRELVRSHRTFLIIDEVHEFKNPQTELSLKMRTIKKYAVAIHGLTATPLSKDLSDSYSIIDFIRPGSLGSFDSFKKTYCVVEQEVVGRTQWGTLRKVEKIKGFKEESLFNDAISHFTVRGSNHIIPEFHFDNYRLNSEEFNIYLKIANGYSFDYDTSDPGEWLKKVVTDNEVTNLKMAEDLTAHSSRFIYLQYAADGIIKKDGTLGRLNSTKFNKVMERIDDIVEKKQSALVYFSFYASLQTFEYRLRRQHPNIRILKSTGKDTFDPNSVNAHSCSRVPHVILCTKAGSASADYPFINNVILVHYPTVPDTMTQFIGRITRANTQFLGDLHVWMYRCPNIDDYKLFLVSHKTGLMETVAGAEGNIPELFKDKDWSARQVKKHKNRLLWYTDYKTTTY